MAEEEIVKELSEFGLGEKEAQAYVFLLKAGPSPARTVSRKLKIDRMRTYRTLRALEEKGFVESVLGRPVRFSAQRIESVLDNYIEQTKMKVSSLEEKRKRIQECSNRLLIAEASEETKFRILQGRQQAHEMLSQMFERAKTEITLTITQNNLYRLELTGIDEILKVAKRRRVRTRVLAQIDENGIPAVKDFMTFATIRHIAFPTPVRIVTIDDREAFTTLAMNDSMSLTTSDDTGIWTNASNYVKATTVTFNALWETAISIETIMEQLETSLSLKESLRYARKLLESSGWLVKIPGTLIGESGTTYSFDLLGEQKNSPERKLVVDITKERSFLNQIMSLNIKVLDVKPTVSILAATRQLSHDEARIAKMHGVKAIISSDPEELATRIRDAANSD